MDSHNSLAEFHFTHKIFSNPDKKKSICTDFVISVINLESFNFLNSITPAIDIQQWKSIYESFLQTSPFKIVLYD